MNGIPSYPSADEVLVALKPITPLLWESLDYGTGDAAGYFAKQGNPFDPFLYPTMVRYRVRQYLRDVYGLVSAEEVDWASEPDTFMRSLSNIGIQLAYGGFELRIRKTEDGVVPPAGVSERTKAFYRQERPLLPFAPGDLRKMWGGNLLVLWEPDSSHRLATIDLAMPIDGSANRAETIWRVPLQRPLIITPRPVPVEDLPIEPLESVESDESASDV